MLSKLICAAIMNSVTCKGLPFTSAAPIKQPESSGEARVWVPLRRANYEDRFVP